MEAEEARDPAREAELQAKVAGIRARLERKKAARARFEAHVAAHPGLAAWGTDYARWDMWCPEDEEDELLASCTPDNPQFHAMEKDINDRHDRKGFEGDGLGRTGWRGGAWVAKLVRVPLPL